MNSPLLSQILKELAASQAQWLVWHSLLWTALGALVGLLGSLVTLHLFKRVGWYESGWRFAGWIRWPLWLGSVALCTALAGGAGLCKGLARGAEQVLAKGHLATSVFPVVGNALADGMAGLQAYASSSNSTAVSHTNLMTRIEAFRAGEWEVDVPLLQDQLDRMEAGAISNLVAKLETNLVARSPQLQGGLPNMLLHQSLTFCGKVIVERKIHSGLKHRKLDRLYAAMRTRLLAQARRSGDPDTISRDELSGFAVQEVVVPGLMLPLRLLLNEQAAVLLALAGLAALLPAPVYRFSLGRVKARPPPSSAPARPPAA